MTEIIEINTVDIACVTETGSLKKFLLVLPTLMTSLLLTTLSLLLMTPLKNIYTLV